MRGLGSILAVWMLGALTIPGIEEGGGSAGERDGPVIAWDQPSTDVSGEEETLHHAEVALTDLETDLNRGGAATARAETSVKAGENEASLGALFPEQPPGKVLVWVCAVDAAGNVSDWGGPLEVEFREKGSEEGGEPEAAVPPPALEDESPQEAPQEGAMESPETELPGPPPEGEPEAKPPDAPRQVERGRPLLPQQQSRGGCQLF